MFLYIVYKVYNIILQNITFLFPFREIMTSHSTSRVPYVGRISVGENDVEFIYQFVKHTKHQNDIEWEDHYLIGTPTKFPNYGDLPRTFSMVYVFLIIFSYYV